MRKLRRLLYQENVTNVDKICKVVEEWLSDNLISMDNQASVLAEKHEGASDLAHYYMGKGMALRQIAEECEIIVEFHPHHDDGTRNYYKDFE